MLTLSEISDYSLNFLDKGGPALWSILLLSLVLWLLILERYWFLSFEFPDLRQSVDCRWRPYRQQKSRFSRRLRESLLNEIRERAGLYLRTIGALTQALPLLGLLGTVSGMIQTFDVISVFGNGNARGLAGGISQALLTTMAGLVTALSGLYFGSDLKQKIQAVLDLVEAEME